MNIVHARLLMSAICSVNCGPIEDAIEAYEKCKVIERAFGIAYYILIKCTYQFTNILDPAEWTAAISSKDVALSPRGTITIPPPTVTPIKATGDDIYITPPVDYQLNYNTYTTDPVNLTDYKYWSEFFKKRESYRLMWVDKNQDFFMADAWAEAVRATPGGPVTVAGLSPGFEFSITQPPVPTEGEGNRFLWQTQMQVTKDGVLQAAKLPGVFSVLS